MRYFISALSLVFLLTLILSCNGGSNAGSTSGNQTGQSSPDPDKQTETPQSPPATAPDTSNIEDKGSETPPPPISTEKILIRQNIYNWDIDGPDMAAYKKGVEVMKSRPKSDPTSWDYQASIHGSEESPSKTGWNQCQHQSFFFLSWHRMYLYYFERILREASGDPDFALPYWDYSNPQQRKIPLAYREPADESNPIFTENRNTGINMGFEIPESATIVDAAFTYDNFYSPAGSPLSFGGQEVDEFTHFGSTNGSIEQSPHNVIHVIVGGWMNDPNRAAHDPIFWLHHANIDRLWNQWIDENPGHQNPVDNAFWMEHPFSFFDEHGNEVKMSGQDIIDSESQLNYNYDDKTESTLVTASPLLAANIDSIPTKKENLLNKTINLEIKNSRTSIPVSLSNKSKNAFSNLGPGKAKQKRMVLNLENITYDAIPSGFYEVYLNLPGNIKDPDYKSDYYVGNIGFFGLVNDPNHDHNGPNEGKTINFEITDLFKKQLKEGIWDFNKLNLSFYLRGLIAPDGTSKSILERIRPDGNIKIGKVTLDSYE